MEIHVISTVAKCNKLLGFLFFGTRLTLWELICAVLFTCPWYAQPCVTEAKFGPLSQALAIYFCLNEYILAPGGACFADLSYRDMLIKFDLIPISYWFEYLDLVFFYKCRNGLFNFDIFKYVTPYSKSRVTRNSFINIDYKPNLTKTSTFRDSYFNRIIPLWNSLPLNTKESITLSSFKTKVHSH